ncbi:unnamed protein product [Echinostoma caproni]|uniref:Uncharacterized protein n=1 Tax=Echinostoma caproni TaxID=27848 RepID=A0A3P8HC73_9TREM|nr:unnamed protein product [Echinostoma caproni]
MILNMSSWLVTKCPLSKHQARMVTKLRIYSTFILNGNCIIFSLFFLSYGKYLGVTTGSNAMLVAIADAIGPREQFEPVFQDGSTALLGVNNCFLSADPHSGDVLFTSQQAKSEEMVTVSIDVHNLYI